MILRLVTVFGLMVWPITLLAQAPGRWPPDSLVNTQVIPRTTPVIQVVGMMRNFAFDLGVRCQFCHVGEEGMPLEQFDFARDEKRTKRTAREMLRLVDEINRRPTPSGRRCAGIPRTPRPAGVSETSGSGPDACSPPAISPSG